MGFNVVLKRSVDTRDSTSCVGVALTHSIHARRYTLQEDGQEGVFEQETTPPAKETLGFNVVLTCCVDARDSTSCVGVALTRLIHAWRYTLQ